MSVNFLPILTDTRDHHSGDSDLATEAMDGSLLGAHAVGSVALPDSEPLDRTVSWVSQLPASPGDQLVASLDVPAFVTVEETVDGLDHAVSCDLPVGIDCPADLPDPQPVTPAPVLDTQPADEGSVVRSGAEHTLLNTAFGEVLGCCETCWTLMFVFVL